MPLEFGDLLIGHEYERPQLAEMWGYEDYHAFSRGVFTPQDQNLIVLFITRNQQPALPQYDNLFDGDLLWMDGAKGHGSDRRLADSAGSDDVRLFYREQSHSPFIYCGEVFRVEAFLSQTAPSRFIFAAQRQFINDAETAIHELIAGSEGPFIPEAEGRRRLRLHVMYERSKKNREQALQIHGHQCDVCEFDFDATYGADLAAAYIEVHHLRSITEINGQTVDPETELIPVCANCHRMAHRRRGSIVPIDELKRRVRDAKAQKNGDQSLLIRNGGSRIAVAAP